ncbi:expressed unknown protein [Seminavis robusta]|uniref:Uncharacterized protein n=1 Tax=Seminavis robusta TaxID=568900 RepID=A0A9N8DJS5_9STRA|nr:expressed unknown protein [Seminavis robusta]|eukprot:Sro122_g059100.1 n/a (100) ;mRNA; r:21211-21510
MKEITITDTFVVDNPVEEAEEMEQTRIEAKRKAVDKAASQQESTSAGAAKPVAKAKMTMIGRYLPKTADTNSKDDDDNDIPVLPKAAANPANSSKPKSK